MWTAEYEKYINDKSEYNLNVYYNGFRNHSVRLENSWTNDGKDYEVGLTLFSNTNKTFDYTFEARYSEKTKELLLLGLIWNLMIGLLMKEILIN